MESSRGANLYQKTKRFSQRLDSVIEKIVVAMMALLVLAIVFQVLYRFVIVQFVSFSFPFTEEFARYMLMWITYLSLGICFKEGMHACVTFLHSALPKKGKMVLYVAHSHRHARVPRHRADDGAAYHCEVVAVYDAHSGNGPCPSFIWRSLWARC